MLVTHPYFIRDIGQVDKSSRALLQNPREVGRVCLQQTEYLS